MLGIVVYVMELIYKHYEIYKKYKKLLTLINMLDINIVLLN